METAKAQEFGFTHKLFFTSLWRKYYTNQTRSQRFFMILLLSMIPLFYQFLVQFVELYWARIEANPSYDWPKFHDLRTAATSCVLCFVLKNGLLKVLDPITYRILRESYQGKEREERAQRASFCAVKSIYFISIVIFGYIVIQDADWLPWIMGGHGDSAKIFDGYPYQNFEKVPLIRGYLMIQLGYHMFSLIAHCMAPARHDFMEMLLHHVSTVLLLSGSYLMNYLPVAALILLIHDIADIFVYGARLFLDTKYVSVAFMSYLGLLTAFIYGRLIVFPFWLIWYAVWFNYDYYQEVPGFWLMAVMLHFLLLLHIYWFFLLLGLGYNYVFKGKATDMHGAKDQAKKATTQTSANGNGNANGKVKKQ